jgi:NitT/TauT family transport system substrate-binding protein
MRIRRLGGRGLLVLGVCGTLLGLSCAPQTRAPSAAAPPGSPATGAPAPASAAQPAAPAAPADAGSPAKIRIGLATETLGRGPLYVANRKGYLRDAGVEIERVNLEGDPRLVAAFLANEIDVAGFGADTVVKMVTEGRDAFVAYSMGQGHDVHMVISKRFAEQRGVDPSAELSQKMSRLKGITIGAPSLGGIGEFRSRWILRQGGLRDEDVSVVQVGAGPAQIAATENDQVDGFTAGPLAPQEAAARGKALIVVRPSELKEFTQYLYSSLSTSKAFAERNPDAMRRLAQALDRAKRYIQEDPEGAIQELKRDFPNVRDEVLREGLAFYRTTYGTDGKMTVAAWRDTLDFLRDGGVLRGEMDPSEGVYWTNRYQP